MEEHDHDKVCNTTLELGLNQYKLKRENLQEIAKPALFLDLSINRNLGKTESSSSLNFFENFEKEKSKGENIDCNYSKNCSRKKLRLTRDQTTFLEDSFKQHSTLNTAQKQALAERLNLKTRQVEVWFQNRRAWRKLKQTEADHKFLKKNCERLNEENLTLKKELLELRSDMMMENPPAAAAAAPAPVKLETCPSCERSRDGAAVIGMAKQ